MIKSQLTENYNHYKYLASAENMHGTMPEMLSWCNNHTEIWKLVFSKDRTDCTNYHPMKCADFVFIFVPSAFFCLVSSTYTQYLVSDNSCWTHNH